MKDGLTFSLLTAAAVASVALASVWPQGYGDRSPGPFGHTPIQQTPEMQAAIARERQAALKRKQDYLNAAASAAAAAGLRTAP